MKARIFLSSFYKIIAVVLAFLSSIEAYAGWSVDYAGEQMRIWNDGRQYAVLHRNSGYFRMNYGPDSGWGTSIVVVPSFWSGGRLYQGTNVTTNWYLSGSNIVIQYWGNIHTLAPYGRITIRPPINNQIVADVKVSVSGSVKLDNRAGEAYKPVFLSSMHVSDTEWDTQGAYNGQYYTQMPDSGLIFNTDITGSRITLDGGTSSWKTNAPTVDIYFDRVLSTMGWVTSSNNPNDDNVGFWLGANYFIRNYSYRAVVRKY